jgi:hypothetical protein
MITAASKARMRVGPDLVFLGDTLPNPADLPPPATVMEWHRDLVAAGSLSEGVAASEPLLRRAVTNLGPEDAERLALELKELADSVTALMKDGWPWSLAELQRSDAATFQRVRPAALAFLAEATEIVEQRATFVARPVSLPEGLPSRVECSQIFQSYASGKNPFGLFAFRLRAYQPIFAQIRLAGLPPTTPDGWQHINSYLLFVEKVTSLSSRWLTLRGELAIPDAVDFGHERLAALDVIADQLQAALVVLPSTYESATIVR